MNRKNSYNLQDLMDCAKELLFGPGNARLPLPPMLMIDRITHISDEGGDYGKGEIIAELDATIGEAVQVPKKTGIGIHFMKFCGKHDMQKAVDQAQHHSEWLSSVYG